MQVMNEEIISGVLACVREWQLETGRSPSYREIMCHCKLSSIGQVQRCIKVLKERGELDSGSGGSIAMDDRFSGGRSKVVPLVGAIACGGPITAVEDYEDVYRMPEDLIGSGEHFMLRAKGDSMTGVGIYEGDLLIIRRQPSANYGQIVAAMVEEEEATIKTFCPKGDGKIVLQAENPDYKDIVMDGRNCRIIGILAGSYRRY